MKKYLTGWYHLLWALAGALVFRFPSREIFLIGVTGTKGKTTVVELLAHVLETAGSKAAFISSVHVRVAENTRRNATGNSMPGRWFIQKFLRRAVSAGCRYAIIEVTSQGVAQSRHRFMDFDAAVFTNLEPEHIEAHGSFERYRAAKLGFFRATAASRKMKKYFVINKDDENARYFGEVARNGEVLWYSGRDADAGQYDGGAHAGNVMAVVTLAKALGIDAGRIRAGLASWRGVPGRMETIQEEPFRVVVDYAHTPKSLELLYRHLGEGVKKGGRLICVLGAAGGGRDRWKREKFGEIAGTYCGEIVLTEEDPYDEDPGRIVSEIRSGISRTEFPVSHVHEVPERKEAIRKAISLAKEGDVVVCTGKGSEAYIHGAHGRNIPWNERGVIEEILKQG